MSTSYLYSILVAFLVSLALTYGLNIWARKRHAMMTTPRDRDIHQSPTPRIGGLAIVATFLLGVSFWLIVDPAQLSFSSQQIVGIDRNLFGFLLAIIVLTFFNVADDFRSIDWRIRLTIQVLCAVFIALFGIKIQWFSNPFGGQIMLGIFDYVFVVLWLVIISNTMNWLDGIDGLSGGIGLISLIVILFLSLGPVVAQKENALLAALGIGAIAGFLPFNFARKKVFLGDTGSIFIGFLVGVVAIISGGKVATAFLVLAIPFLDAIIVVVSRLKNRQSPFLADQRHLHHRLLAIGLKPWQILLLLYGLSAAFGLVALNTQSAGKMVAIVIALVIMGILVALYNYAPRIGRALALTKESGNIESGER